MISMMQKNETGLIGAETMKDLKPQLKDNRITTAFFWISIV
jgi:hypothetical protein